MTTVDNATLRAAREKRIAERNASAGAPAPVVAATTPVVAQGTQSQETKTEPVAVQPPIELVAKIVDPATVPRTAEISTHLFNEGSEDPHWLVCASGVPVAEIRLQDQVEPQRIARLFVTDKYAQGIREASKQMGLDEVLTGVKARVYIAAVSGADTYKHLETQVRAASVEEGRKRSANLRDSMLNMLGLVVQAQTKNFVTENPIKDALFHRMVKAGLDSGAAVNLIEAAWQDKGMEHFEFLFRQAAKYMDMSPEVLVELRETIGETPHRTPTVTAGTVTPSAAPKAPVTSPKSSANVPLMTTAGSYMGQDQQMSEKERMRDTLGFRSRRLNHDMSPK